MTAPTVSAGSGDAARATRFVHLLALGIDPAWRRRSAGDHADDLFSFSRAHAAAAGLGVASVPYSSIGLEPGSDVLLWRTAARVEDLEEAAAVLLASGLGTWCRVAHSFLGRTAPSQYAAAAAAEEPIGDHGERYLVAYPFTKSTDWYLLSREARQGVMNEHMRVGRAYPMVRQALAYSFGLDDQDFLVAYETDDLGAFGDLVRELRSTQSRRSTVSDTPLLLGVRRDVADIARLLGVELDAAPSR